jgi:hypothetical protein
MRDVSDGRDGRKNNSHANHASQRGENETRVHYALQIIASKRDHGFDLKDERPGAHQIRLLALASASPISTRRRRLISDLKQASR